MMFGGITIEEALSILREYPFDRVVRDGFSSPASWRGAYSELAVEPDEGVTVWHMIDTLTLAIGTTYYGYKGGEFTMSKHSEVHLANWGELGEPLTPRVLRYMLESEVDPS